jgi:hypothetical protein
MKLTSSKHFGGLGTLAGDVVEQNLDNKPF